MKNIFVRTAIMAVCTYFLTYSLMAMEEGDFGNSPSRVAYVERICTELGIQRGQPLRGEQEDELLLRTKRGDEDAFYIFCEWNFPTKPQIVNTTIRNLTWEGNEIAFRFYVLSLTYGRYAYGKNLGHVRFRIDGILDGSYVLLAQYPHVVREARRLKLEGLKTGKYGYSLDKGAASQFERET